jgi:SAM-dependent methyltransferase
VEGAAYGPDLAAAHHEQFGFVAEAAAGVVLAELARRHRDGGLVVDLGCGSGIMAARLAAAGYGVLGVDRSEAMLALARRQAPTATFVQGSLHDVAIPPCVAVCAVGECCNYAVGGGPAGPEVLGALARRAWDALRPGGVVVLDVAGPGRAGPGRRREGVVDRGGWWVWAGTEEDAAGAVLDRRITVFRRVDDGHWRRSDEHHRLRLVPPAAVAGALRAAGFRVRSMRRYGDLELEPGWTAFVARKP